MSQEKKPDEEQDLNDLNSPDRQNQFTFYDDSEGMSDKQSIDTDAANKSCLCSAFKNLFCGATGVGRLLGSCRKSQQKQRLGSGESLFVRRVKQAQIKQEQDGTKFKILEHDYENSHYTEKEEELGDQQNRSDTNTARFRDNPDQSHNQSQDNIIEISSGTEDQTRLFSKSVSQPGKSERFNLDRMSKQQETRYVKSDNNKIYQTTKTTNANNRFKRKIKLAKPTNITLNQNQQRQQQVSREQSMYKTPAPVFIPYVSATPSLATSTQKNTSFLGSERLNQFDNTINTRNAVYNQGSYTSSTPSLLHRNSNHELSSPVSNKEDYEQGLVRSESPNKKNPQSTFQSTLEAPSSGNNTKRSSKRKNMSSSEKKQSCNSFSSYGTKMKLIKFKPTNDAQDFVDHFSRGGNDNVLVTIQDEDEDANPNLIKEMLQKIENVRHKTQQLLNKDQNKGVTIGDDMSNSVLQKNKREKKSKSEVGKKSLKSNQRSSRSDYRARQRKLQQLVKIDDVLSISSRPQTRYMRNKAANLVNNLKTTANKIGLLNKPPFTTPKPFKD